jgi:hypothetical protein
MAIIADDWTIINTMGIRYVQKSNADEAYARNPLSIYGLIVHYKGTHVHYMYPTAALRDAQFDALRAAMATKKNG